MDLGVPRGPRGELVDDPPTRWSLAEMVGAVGDRVLSVRELVGAHLQRSASLQPRLNAYTSLDEEGALAAAGRLDDALAAGEGLGPLAGVPIGLKDLIDQAGLPTTCGSSFYRKVPRESAPVVRRLEEAGAVIIGRTGLHEWAFGFSSENPWWGPVRNPWDPATSPGGSSGGSAAAVAAGLAAGAVGTDTGGSVRVPAALCGVVGLKVTYGGVPSRGAFPLSPSLDTVGPVARSVQDVELLYRVMADRPGGPWRGRLAGLSIGVPRPWVGSYPIAPEVAEGFGRAMDRLSEAGAQVSDLPAPGLEPVGEILYAEAAVVHRLWFPHRAEEYGKDVADRLREARKVTAEGFANGRAGQQRLRARVAGLFQEVDLLATPATQVVRKPIGQEVIAVDGGEYHYRPLLSGFSSLVNQMGNPALVAPLAAQGDPPPALQLIAPWDGEELLLGVGRALEEAGIVAVRPAPIW